jgi:AcrR family transcriptional regulator
MATLAAACGTSKARLYHYYGSKEAILFELLDRYTRRLVEIADLVHSEALEHRLAPREELDRLIAAFLDEYQTSRYRHAALLNDVRFLAPTQRARVIAQERTVAGRFAELVQKAYPGKVGRDNAKPLTMMLFGMINWTFTWMKPGGPMSYAEFARLVAQVLADGINGLPQARLPAAPGEATLAP